MAKFLIRRFIRMILAILGVSTVVFFTLRLSGDPIGMLLPPEATLEDRNALAHELGFDQPLPVQYVRFLSSAVRGDFGESLRFRGQSAMKLVLERLPATIELAIAAVAFGWPIAFGVGILSALKKGSMWDSLAMVIALIGQSVPLFWLGLILIVLVGANWRLLPTSGYGTWQNLVLPMIALGVNYIALVARLLRSALLEVMGQDYIRTARAKGISETRVLVSHALKNAAIPVVTIMGLQVGGLLSGAVITETVFAWPGMGRLAVQSVLARDYPVVQAAVFVAALIFVGVNTLIDIGYALIDPQIKYS